MRRRNLTILAGLACLAVIVFAAATVRREIMTRYHLGLLRSDPAYLRGIVDQPEGTPARAAIQRHLESEGGKHDLIRAIRDWFPDWLFKEEEAETHVVVYLEVEKETVNIELEPDAVKIAEIGILGSPWLKLIQEHLVGSKEWKIPEYPTLRFRFTITVSPDTRKPSPASK
jgi:hypothetical protein